MTEIGKSSENVQRSQLLDSIHSHGGDPNAQLSSSLTATSLASVAAQSSLTAVSSSSQKKVKGKDYSEISPNKRYIRFNESLNNTANIKASYRGFDTKNGIEVVWQKIYLSDLGESEQEPIMRSLNYLKHVQQKHIVEYLSVWVTEEPRTVNLITTYLDPLESFIAKVKTLRWRIIKKWCKQLLTGLHYLHTSSPVIVHRNLNLGNIFMNGGLGEIYLGGMWLSSVLVDGAESVSVSDLISTYCYQGRQPGSPAYKAPEVLANQPLTTKVDIYSFGMCLLVLLTKEDPYVEIYGAQTIETCRSESGDSVDEHPDETVTANEEAEEALDVAREIGYAAIASLIRKGVLPDAIERVTQSNPEAGAFLRSCLALDPRDRKTAEELLNDVFLQQTTGDGGDDNVVIKSAVIASSVACGPQLVDSDGSVPARDITSAGATSADDEAQRFVLSPAEVDSALVVTPLSDVLPSHEVISESLTKEEPTISSDVISTQICMDEHQVKDTSPISKALMSKDGVPCEANEAKSENMPALAVGIDFEELEKKVNATIPNKNLFTSDSHREPDVTLGRNFESNVESEVTCLEARVTDTFADQSAANIAKRLSLVQELAKFGTSDDVNDDRGIHDGRRDKNSPEKAYTKQSEQQISTAKSKIGRGSSAPEHIAADVPKPSYLPNSQTQGGVFSNDTSNIVVVQLQINGRYTSDGINKEVEFTFQNGSDQVEIIAAEMKEELHLNLSVEHLVHLIRDEIVLLKSRDNSSSPTVKVKGLRVSSSSTSAAIVDPPLEKSGFHPEKQGQDQFRDINKEANLSNGAQSQVVQELMYNVATETSAAILSQSPTSLHSMEVSLDERATSDVKAVVDSTVKSDTVSGSEQLQNSTAELSTVLSSFNESVEIKTSEVINTTISATSRDDSNSDSVNLLLKLDQSVETVMTSSSAFDHLEIPPPSPTRSESYSINSPIRKDVSSPDNYDCVEHPSPMTNQTSPNIKRSDTSTSSSPGSNNASVAYPHNSTGSTCHVVPLPDENATISEVADYHTYLTEIAAIEKESRAASRVFEQRIQKHKIIQETCEDDLLKMDENYSKQRGRLSSKQSAAERKREEELTHLRAEFQKNVNELKANRQQQRLQHAHQQQSKDASRYEVSASNVCTEAPKTGLTYSESGTHQLPSDRVSHAASGLRPHVHLSVNTDMADLTNISNMSPSSSQHQCEGQSGSLGFGSSIQIVGKIISASGGSKNSSPSQNLRNSQGSFINGGDGSGGNSSSRGSRYGSGNFSTGLKSSVDIQMMGGDNDGAGVSGESKVDGLLGKSDIFVDSPTHSNCVADS